MDFSDSSRYRTEELVHAGAQGVVYRAIDSQTGATVALKWVSSARSDYHSASVRLHNEFLTLSSLVGVKGAVEVLAWVDAEEGCGLVLEWVEALDLKREVSANGPWRWGEWNWLARELFYTLAACHRRHTLHLDLKPGNVLSNRRGTFRLIDFGIAQSEGYLRLEPGEEVMGTLPYIAPERLLGDSPDPSSDLYSAGILLYEVLTGILPFDSDQPAEMQAIKLQGRFQDPTLLNPEAPPWVNAFFHCLLAPDSAARPRGAQQALALLAHQGQDKIDHGVLSLRACGSCHSALWKDLPFCTFCGRPYALDAKWGSHSVVIWRVENKNTFSERMEILADTRWSPWTRSLFMGAYPRIFLWEVDEATAQLAAATCSREGVQAEVTRKPWRAIIARLGFSTLEQILVVTCVAALIFSIFYKIFELALTILGIMACLSFRASAPLISRRHLRSRSAGRKVWSAEFGIRKNLDKLNSEVARDWASLLVRRAKTLANRIDTLNLTDDIRRGMLADLGEAVVRGLTILVEQESEGAVLRTARGEGVNKKRVALQEQLALERGQNAGRMIEAIKDLSRREDALLAIEARQAARRCDFATIASDISSLHFSFSEDGNIGIAAEQLFEELRSFKE